MENIIYKNAIDALTLAKVFEENFNERVRNHDVYLSEKRLSDLNREVNRLRIVVENDISIKRSLNNKIDSLNKKIKELESRKGKKNAIKSRSSSK